MENLDGFTWVRLFSRTSSGAALPQPVPVSAFYLVFSAYSLCRSSTTTTSTSICCLVQPLWEQHCHNQNRYLLFSAYSLCRSSTATTSTSICCLVQPSQEQHCQNQYQYLLFSTASAGAALPQLVPVYVVFVCNEDQLLLLWS